MITPIEIEKKEFSKGVRGYSIDEVDEFLDAIIVDLEQLLKENQQLKLRLEGLEQENAKLKGTENGVYKLMEQAKGLMGDISASAEKRAAAIMKNAQLDAELTLRDAKNRAAQLVEENQRLEKRYHDFRDRYRTFLQQELDRFSNLDENMFPLSEPKLEDLVNEPVTKPNMLASDPFLDKAFETTERPQPPRAEPANRAANQDAMREAMDDRRTVIVTNE